MGYACDWDQSALGELEHGAGSFGVGIRMPLDTWVSYCCLVFCNAQNEELCRRISTLSAPYDANAAVPCCGHLLHHCISTANYSDLSCLLY